jgi:simple sugar transport system ATP-binding protein
MLYRDNEVLIFDEPTAVLTPQEIEELMHIMRGLAAEGKSILFISHKLAEIKELADRCTVLRKGKYVGTVDVGPVTKEELSEMMVGRKVNFSIEKEKAVPGEPVLTLEHVSMRSRLHHKLLLDDVSFSVRRGEIVTIAGIDGNGQRELVYAVSGLGAIDSGRILMRGEDISKAPIRRRNDMKMSHIPEDRHKHGLVLDFSLSENLALKSYQTPEYQNHGFIRFGQVEKHADELIQRFDIRSGQGGATVARSMSGGNQQKAIVAREISLEPDLLIAVQPTRGLDVGAIEYIHKQLVAARDRGCAVLLISLELDEVKSLSDEIFVIFEGRIVAQLDPEAASIQEIGLYMAGSKRGNAS